MCRNIINFKFDKNINCDKHIVESRKRLKLLYILISDYVRFANLTIVLFNLQQIFDDEINWQSS